MLRSLIDKIDIGKIVDSYFMIYSGLFFLSFVFPNVEQKMRSNLFLMLTFFLTILQIFKNTKGINRQRVFNVILLVALLTTNMYINDSGFGSVIQYMIIIMNLLYKNEFIMKKKYYVFGLGILVFVNILLAIKSFNGYYQFYMINRNEQYMINPNQFGVAVVYVTTLLAPLIYIKTQDRNIITLNLYLAFNFLVVYFLENRASLLALMIYIVVLNTYIFVFEIQNNKCPVCMKYILLLFIIGSLFYPIVMARIYNYFGNGTQLSMKGSLFSKAIFSGREKIWNNFIIQMFKEPKNLIFGMGSNSIFWKPQHNLNLHHSFLNVYNNHGILFIYIYIKLMYKKWFLNYKYQKNSRPNSASLLLTLGVFPMLVLGSFENIVTSFPYIILLLVYFVDLKVQYEDSNLIKVRRVV